MSTENNLTKRFEIAGWIVLAVIACGLSAALVTMTAPGFAFVAGLVIGAAPIAWAARYINNALADELDQRTALLNELSQRTAVEPRPLLIPTLRVLGPWEHRQHGLARWALDESGGSTGECVWVKDRRANYHLDADLVSKRIPDPDLESCAEIQADTDAQARSAADHFLRARGWVLL